MHRSVSQPLAHHWSIPLTAHMKTVCWPQQVFRPAPLLSSRSEAFVNATPSGEVQIRDRIFGEKGVRDNLTNQRQSDLISVHRSEGIRGTQVPEGD